MRRAVLLVIALAGAAHAQEAPQVTVELDADAAVVGQPKIVSITVLVPTYMPTPPEFPPLEVPGLLVRLPERASGPVSGTVEGASWSGVRRRYRLYPLHPGSFEIPGQTLSVTYADPETNAPVSTEETLEPIRFEVAMPEGAADLDPPIVAQDFTLEATLEAPEELKVGDAVVRTVTAQITGTTPILIPALTPAPGADAALRVYPDEPRVSESEDRGTLSGQRVERTTYLATAEGPAELPAIRFAWFNLATGKLETAEVPAVPLSISPGAASATGATAPSWRSLLFIAAGLSALAGLLFAIGPRLRRRAAQARRDWLASEHHAWAKLGKAMAARRLSTLYPALDRWARFHPDLERGAIDAALLQLGQARYGTGGDTDGWSALSRALRSARQAARAHPASAGARRLQLLNPDWPPARPK